MLKLWRIFEEKQQFSQDSTWPMYEVLSCNYVVQEENGHENGETPGIHLKLERAKYASTGNTTPGIANHFKQGPQIYLVGYTKYATSFVSLEINVL